MNAKTPVKFTFRDNPGFACQLLNSNIGVVVILLMCGCATERPVGVIEPAPGTLTDPVPLDAKTIALTCSINPARVEFDQAVGAVKFRSDASAEYARACLEPPNGPESGFDAVYSPIGFVAAPFAAAYGALSGGHHLTGDELSECKSDLNKAMAEMADQKRLRQQVLEAAGESTTRRVILVDSTKDPTLQSASAGAVLETSVEELRLERTKSNDNSFALRIKARALVRRVSDQRVLGDKAYEYQSGTASFLDWSNPQGLRSVAETGYRELAKRIASEFFGQSTQPPILVGAAYNNPGGTPMSRPLAPTAAVLNNRSSLMPAVFDIDAGGIIGIYPATSVQIDLQKPLTKDEAVSEAASDLDWSLDGLQDSRNLVVQVSACAAAIPVSLWKQGAALAQGVTEKQYRTSEAQLSAVAKQARPSFEVANQVTMDLSQRTSQPVVLVNSPFPDKFSESPNPVLPVSSTSSFAQGDLATVLEIRVNKAALAGSQSINPSLALCVEAEVSCVRAKDRAVLFRRPVHYRGASRKFAHWAAKDAQLFRQELQTCYAALSHTIIDELSAEKVITPPISTPTLANQ